MKAIRRYITGIVVCGLAAVSAGCFGSSPQSRFYTFAPHENGSAPQPAVPDTAIVVGPVTIPDYLDRNQIVSRSGRNEIIVAEFDRWGGPLESEITRALVGVLADRLDSTHLGVFPWRRPTLGNVPTVYRIPVNVTRFDGIRGGKVVLNATWTVFARGGSRDETVISKESTITEETGGKSYSALVDAMGKAVDELGKEMAGELRAVIDEKGGK